MKKFSFIFALALYLIGSLTVTAQNPVATLESNGTTKVFYGINALIDSYNASANGDKIYLSTGYFNPPPSIAKGIKITGAGHFPDSANVAKRTTILSAFTIVKGADSLHLEGLYINFGIINFDENNSINYVSFKRCSFDMAWLNSFVSSSKNNCSFEECIIGRDILVGYDGHNNAGNNFLMKHCIINGLNHISGGAVIEGNVFLAYSNPLNRIKSSLIKDNIFLSQGEILNGCDGNVISNNMSVVTQSSFGSNSSSQNYIGIPQTSIFVNQTGNTFDYSHNYHLKTPASYPGTDGTQVGLYGGAIPFKDKGLPSNPQIITKNVAAQTDANGKLQINFTVKAQSN